jgi:hypothetical protein
VQSAAFKCLFPKNPKICLCKSLIYNGVNNGLFADEGQGTIRAGMFTLC